MASIATCRPLIRSNCEADLQIPKDRAGWAVPVLIPLAVRVLVEVMVGVLVVVASASWRQV